MKKLITAFLAIAMTATSFTGCALFSERFAAPPSEVSQTEAQTEAQTVAEQTTEAPSTQSAETTGQGSADLANGSAEAQGKAGRATGELASDIKVGETYTLYNSSLKKYFLLMVLKNTSSTAASVNVDCVFFDGNDSVLGTSKKTTTVFDADSEIVLRFECDEAFAKYEYRIDAKEKPKYYAPVVKDLSCKTDLKENKVILSITNNGKIDAEFVQFHVLFFKGDTLVYDGWGYCNDSDNKIKAGATEYKDVVNYSNEAFDNVKVYLDSRGKV